MSLLDPPLSSASIIRALGYTPLSNTVNQVTVNSASTLTYRKAIAKVLSGQRARLLVLGDSTTAGAGSGTNSGGTSGMVGARAKSWPSYLARSLTSLGIPAYNESVFGDQNCSTALETYNAYDPRVNVGAWAAQNFGSLGGKGWTVASAGATFAFTPNMTFDTFDVYTSRFTTLGSVTVNVDGGATLATINENGTNNVIKTTVSCARGTHTINVVAVSGTAVTLLGIVPYDSTLGGLDIIQGAHWGGLMANLAVTANPYSVVNSANLALIAPDLAVVQMTINDANGGTVPATYATQLATVEGALATAGAETILMSGIPSNNPATTNGQLAAIVAAVQARAVSQNRLYADLWTRCGTFAAMNGIGWMYDSVHGTAPLYADEGRWMANVALSQVR